MSNILIPIKDDRAHIKAISKLYANSIEYVDADCIYVLRYHIGNEIAIIGIDYDLNEILKAYDKECSDLNLIEFIGVAKIDIVRYLFPYYDNSNESNDSTVVKSFTLDKTIN